MAIFNIYCHDKLVSTIETIIKLTVQKKYYDLLNQRIYLNEVKDGQKITICEHLVTFFDIHSTKAKQFGFMIKLNTGKLTCLGDEPFNELCYQYSLNSKWLLCEAFCLYKDRYIFKPYQKHHSTVKEASELAERLKIKNLILYHTEEQNLKQRKQLYTKEAKQYFSGNIYVPDDLEKYEL